MSVRLALVPAALIAVALTGCTQAAKNDSTTNKFSGQQKQIAKVVDDLQKQTESKNGAKICANLITAELQQKIAQVAGAKGCGAAVKQAIKESDQSDLSVRTVTIDPSDPAKATAVVKQKTNKNASRDTTLQFEKQGSSWRISALG